MQSPLGHTALGQPQPARDAGSSARRCLAPPNPSPRAQHVPPACGISHGVLCVACLACLKARGLEPKMCRGPGLEEGLLQHVSAACWEARPHRASCSASSCGEPSCPGVQELTPLTPQALVCPLGVISSASETSVINSELFREEQPTCACPFTSSALHRPCGSVTYCGQPKPENLGDGVRKIKPSPVIPRLP